MTNHLTTDKECSESNNSNICYRDNIPTIHLASWPIRASLWDGDKVAGLVPTLFSPDIEVNNTI